MKVKIENFQSIKKAELEIKGLTVITGPNNTGKSACARALAGVFSNMKGSSHVRIGEKHSEVRVDFEDGNVVVWKKGTKINDYEINGKVISKVGTEIPEEVLGLGVKSVEVDGREIWPQIARQFEQVFLLDLPASSLSSALSDVDKILQLENAISESKSDMKAVDSELKYAKEYLKREELRLESYGGLEEMDSLLGSIEEKEEEVSKYEKRIEELGRLKREKDRVLNEIEEMKGLVEVEGLLKPVKGVEDKRIELGFISEVRELMHKKKESLVMIGEEGLLSSVGVYLEHGGLEDKRIEMGFISEVKSLKQAREEASKIVKQVEKEELKELEIEVKGAGHAIKMYLEVSKLMGEREFLKKFIKIEGALKELGEGSEEQIREVDSTDEKIDEMLRLKRARTKVYLLHEIIDAGLMGLEVREEWGEDLKRVERMNEIERLGEMRSRWGLELRESRKGLEEVEGELVQLKKDIGECPLCGNLKEKEHKHD